MSEPGCKELRKARPRAAIALGLLLLIATHALVNMWWLAVDNHPVIVDEDKHMHKTRQHWKALFSPDGRKLSARAASAAGIATEHPPLTYVLGAAWMTVAGRTPDRLAFSMTLWFAALILGVYALCTTFLTPWEALFAAFVVSLTPIVYAFSRYYSVDFPATALVVWAIFALVKSDRFQRTRWVILFSIVAALSLLTKISALFFWIAPLAFVLCQALAAARGTGVPPVIDRRGLGTAIRNAVLSAALIALLAAPWFLYHFEYLFGFWMKTHSAGQGQAVRWSSETADFRLYPFLLINLCTFLPLFALAVAGVASAALVKRYRTTPAALVVLWLLGAYLVLTVFVEQKEARYMFSAVPALGILAAMAVLAVPGRRCRLIAVGGVSLALAAQCAAFTSGCIGDVVHGVEGRVLALELPWPEYQKSAHWDVCYFGSGKLSLYRNALISDSYSYCPPYRGENFVDRCFRTMVRDLNARPGPATDAANCLVISALDTVPGLSNADLYDPEPNPFAVSQWRDAPVGVRHIHHLATRFKRRPEGDLPELERADYVILKVPESEAGLAMKQEWTAFLAGRGFTVLDAFFDRGYGLCMPGLYVVMAGPARPC